MTDVERKLWGALREKQLKDCRFRRQHPIGPYIIDFACAEVQLAIELDGGQHQDQSAYDEMRTTFIGKHGWRVLRFWNNDVLENLEGVVAVISAALDAAIEAERGLCGKGKTNRDGDQLCRLRPPPWPSPWKGEGTAGFRRLGDCER